MLQQLFTIARNTFIESIRQPIFIVMILIGTLFFVLSPSLAAYTLDDDNKLLLDIGLSTLLVFGLLLAAFTATGVLAHEIDNRTVLTVVSKPVSRPIFIVGKYAGVSAALAVAYFILAILFLLMMRHGVMQTASTDFDGPVLTFGSLALLGALAIATAGNYFYRWVWTSSAVLNMAWMFAVAYLLVLLIGKGWQFQGLFAEFQHEGSQLGQIMIAVLMVFQAVLILSAVAICTSTRLGQVMTLVACVMFFGLGMMSDYLLGRYADQSAIASILYRITPNLSVLWGADALTQQHAITAGYLGLISAYAVAYIGGLLCLATALFQTREVG